MSFLDQFEINLQSSLRKIEQNLRDIQDIVKNQDIVLKTSKKQFRKKRARTALQLFEIIIP